MLKFVLRMTRSLLFAGAACAAAAPLASAVEVTFENPPYAPGSVLGQDGWSATAYFPTLNGTVEVSSTSPLAGAQSLSYTRTEAGLAGNGADVVKTDVVTVFKDGTPAADLNATFLISSTSLSTQGMGFGVNGLFLSPAGASGVTPIGIRLTNAGSTIPSVEIYADNGGSGAFFYFGGSLAAAAFPENDTLEFSIDVDFDSSTYNVAYRNVTTGSPFVDSGSVRPFASAYTPNGDGTYDVDVIAAFRFGAGRVDNIRLTGNIVPEPAAAGLAGLAIGAVATYRRRRR